MNQEDIAKKLGQPLPKPLPSVGEQLKAIVDGLEKLGKAGLSGARAHTAQAHLGSVLSMINADLANLETVAKAKANTEQIAKIAEAEAALKGK